MLFSTVVMQSQEVVTLSSWTNLLCLNDFYGIQRNMISHTHTTLTSTIYVTGYGKTDHLRQTLNLCYASSKFNSQYANFDLVRYFQHA